MEEQSKYEFFLLFEINTQGLEGGKFKQIINGSSGLERSSKSNELCELHLSKRDILVHQSPTRFYLEI